MSVFQSSQFIGVIDTLGLQDTTLAYQLPFSSELLIGLEDRAEFGFQYGNELSISGKALLWEETDRIPDIAFGVRSIFGSQEGRLYGVTSPDTLRRMRGEAYLAAAKNLAKITRLHIGASVIGQIDDGQAGFFGGIEQYMGAGFYTSYDIFQRFGGLHQSLAFSWKFRDYFGISVGFSEFQGWLSQGGAFGFYTAPQEARRDGYGAPGIAINTFISGFMMPNDRESQAEKVKKMESQQFKMEKAFNDYKNQVDQLVKQVDDLKEKKGSEGSAHKDQAELYLQMITKRVNSDLSFDPQELQDLRQKLLDMGNPSTQYLTRLLATPTGDVNMRIQACILMGMSKKAEFVKPLLDATADAEPLIRREAILALGKLDNKVALDYARNMLQDPDQDVILAAQEAMRLLGTDPPPMKIKFEDKNKKPQLP